MSYLLQQPNGLLAYYSTISDEFEYWNMGLEAAVVVAWKGGGTELLEAGKSLIRALNDETLPLHDNDGLPHHRWRAALESAHKGDHLATVKADATAPAQEPINQEMVAKLLSLPTHALDLHLAKIGQVAYVRLREFKYDLIREIGLFDPSAWEGDALAGNLLDHVDERDRDGLEGMLEFFERLYGRDVAR